MVGLEQLAFAVEDHRPLHGVRGGCHVRKANDGSVLVDEEGWRHGKGGQLLLLREGGGVGDLRGSAGKGGVAQAGTYPVGRGVELFFGADVVEGRDGEGIDGRGEKSE